MKRSSVWLDWLNVPALIAVAVWGGSHVATKVALDYLPMLSVVGVRLLGAAPVLLGLAWLVERRLLPRRSDLPLLFAMVLCFTGIQVMSTLALTLTTASAVALFFAASPIFVALLAAVVGQEPFRRVRLAGTAISFAGVGLVIGTGPGSLNPGDWLGGFAGLLAGLSWALMILVMAKLLRFYSSLLLNTWAVIAVGLSALPFTARDLAAADWAGFPLEAWAAFAYVAFGSNVLSRILWFVGVKRSGSTVTAVYGFLEPVFTMLFALALLGERLTALQLAGAAVIFLGIAVAKELLPRPTPLPVGSRQ